MQPNLFPFPNPLLSPFLFNGAFNFNSNLSGGDAEGFQFQSSSSLFLVSFLLFQGGDMDLSKVGDKILSSVRSARSLGLLPSTSDRPEVPARAAAAAVVARALAGIPPHQRFSIQSSSEELSSMYGSRPSGEVVEELEEDFYKEEFDPIKHILEHIPSEESELVYFEKQATLRLAQLDKVAERLSRQVMDHHEVMVKGMHLVREVEKDLKVANVICMNGRRHLNSSRNEVSRDLVVNSDSKKKQALQNMLPILNELRHALSMQAALDSLVAEGNYCKAFQVLSEYLQLLDSFSELTVIQEMSRGVEVWLGKTLQKLDSLLLGVCQEFQVEGYITVIDAYSLIGDISGLAEKIQSFFLQEVLSETHSVLKNAVQEDQDGALLSSRLTFSDLCLQIPESKFRQCLLRTLAALFKLMCSYHIIMSFQPEEEVTASQPSGTARTQNESSLLSGEVQEIGPVSRSSLDLEINIENPSNFVERLPELASIQETNSSSIYLTKTVGNSVSIDSCDPVVEAKDEDTAASSSGSPWYQLRRDATTVVSQTLQRGRKNIWQLITSRVSVLLSCNAACSTSIHQFLRNYEDLNVFILAGEAFCGVEAVEFRQKLKAVCQSYFSAFHRQNIHALKMVLERETWLRLPPETLQVISFTGLVGDGAALIISSYDNSVNSGVLRSDKSMESFEVKKKGFSQWLEKGNLFSLKLISISKEGNSPMLNGGSSGPQGGKIDDALRSDKSSSGKIGINHVNGISSVSEEENEDLLADFIDEDSQLPSRVSKLRLQKNTSSNFTDEEISAQTGSSLSLLRSMDKYARLMQKLEVINIEIFKGICQLFEIFFLFVFETFGQQSMYSDGKGVTDSLNYRLKTALSRINQDCDQWTKSQPSLSSSTSLNSTFGHMDVTPVSPPSTSLGSFGLKERCASADSISLVSRILHKSKPHLQLILLQHNSKIVEDFYVNLVNSVPDLTAHIHKTTARLLLHINGYADRVANAKWEPKELGLEHNGYVDLLLGEFKHYKTRLAHGGIHKEVQDLLLEYGLENVAETLIEGLSRVKRCTDEGRALMSLDLQVLINGLRHFVSTDVKPKFQTVEAFIKAYYLPETEFVHWARAHPEYSKSQIVGLINLVALMKGWKRKTRLEILEKIE